MRNRLGIIGNPLGHSLSPILHAEGMKDLNEKYTYEKWELDKNELASFLNWVRLPESKVLGFNVTIPYKEIIIPYLDLLDEEAKVLQAINTVKVEDGLLKGYNTDGLGFYESIKRHGFIIDNSKILVIGSGGAARGISMYLAQQNIDKIDIAGRNIDKNKKLVTELNRYTSSFCISLNKIGDLNISDYDLIVQTTPIGMKNSGGVLEFPYEKLSKKQVVVDIVYNPLNTDFLKKVKGKVGSEISGLEMLVYQGYHSFKIWTGLEENTKVMFQIGKSMLEEESE